MLEYLRRIADTNLAQRREEGVRPPTSNIELPTSNVKQLLEFIEELEASPVREGFPYEEPNGLRRIRELAPPMPELPELPDADTIRDKVLGGWLGRAAGCRLGRPIEGTPYGYRKEDVRRFLEDKGLWPITGYFHIGEPFCALDTTLPRPFPGMIRDDDIDYVILNLLILERFGPDWTYEQARETWLRHLSRDFIYAAGRSAYEGFCIGLMPPRTATWGNPCRQSLGAMIRCDTWGWANPGDPVRAAELAHRDAVISQTANGIYAGMFFAAMIAAAFVESDIRRLIEIGLSQIPANCRLAEAVQFVVDTCEWESGKEGERGTSGSPPHPVSPSPTPPDRVYERYGDLYFNHSIINACIVLLGLLSGGGDFERTIVNTVTSGFDADCTGATAGSILGVTLGGNSIPRKWVEPLNNTYETFLAGLGVQRFTDLAERTAKLSGR